MMPGFLQSEIKYSFRMLRKQPSFALAAIGIMALGIGATTMVFSIVYTVLLRSLPYRDPGRLAAIEGNFEVLKMANIGASPREYLNYRSQSKAFEQIAAFSIQSSALTGGDRPENIQMSRVSDNLLELLGIDPSKGRAFSQDDYQSPEVQTAIISDSLWTRHFGRAEDIIGQTIRLDGTPYRIICVMPRGTSFQYLRPNSDDRVDVWLPLVFTQDELDSHADWFLRVIGRLEPGVDFAIGRSEVGTIGGSFVQRFPDIYRGPHGEDGGWRTTVFPLKQQVLGNVSTSLFVLLAAAGLVLLVACANLAGLILAKGISRRGEIAIRSGLGASRLQICVGLMIEGGMLAIAGGASGLLLVLWTRDLVISIGGRLLPRLSELSIDGRVLGFTILLSLATPLIFALAPAVNLSKASLTESLKTVGRGTVRSHNRLYYTLVAFELALSLVLLISAGLMVRSFVHLRRTNLRFNPNNVVTMAVDLPAQYDSPRSARFFADLLDQLRPAPEIQSASVQTAALKDPFSIEGRPFSPTNLTVAYHRLVGPDYFRCLQAPLLSGREFSKSDIEGQLPVAVINSAMASQFFSSENPLGQRIKVGAPGSPAPWLTVIGVVENIRDRGPAIPAEPEMYAAYLQAPSAPATLLARSGGGTSAAVTAVEDVIAGIDRNQPVSNVGTLAETLSSSVDEPRFDLALLAAFSLIALVLSATGTYGVVSYATGQRTQEIGVRLALGATRSQVLRLVVARGLIFGGMGMLGGIAGSLFATRLIASLLYGVGPSDLTVYAVLSILVALVCVAACLVPATRACRIDPAVALRLE